MLNDILPQLQSHVRDWAEQLRRERWISQRDLDALLEFETRTPTDFFNQEERPLVVAFFGGTGVGKSSLLNRLAGESIARTGVERPTSREVTLYLHQSASLNKLPKTFPTDDVRVSVHRKDSNRDVLWIDMPDFDSAEQANKDMVLAWLPYIDVLIYVVNPERYKDDKGWRLLLEHGRQHAWLFAINHWDRGDDAQRDDFQRLLAEAGLDDPMIFCTDSKPGQPSPDDDFAALESTIQNLADDNIIRILEERGINLRIQSLRSDTERLSEKIGTADGIDKLMHDWHHIWTDTAKDITLAQQWPIARLSENFASTPSTRWLSSVTRVVKGKEPPPPSSSETPIIQADDIWDAQVKSLADNALAKLHHRARVRGLASGPIKKGALKLRDEPAALFEKHLRTSLSQALQAPGSHLHRLAHTLLGYATTALPIAAMCWVAYRLIAGFYLGNSQGQSYLGFDFAIHSLLLVGLAWLLPAFIHHKTKPSLRDAAQAGMRSASRKTLSAFNDEVLAFLEQLKRKQQQAIVSGSQLFSENLLQGTVPNRNREKILNRLLMDDSRVTH
ncbi:MAG TPA: GTP-binding protein [Gammaproteobacteria bacterium]|nr:GTP-binding protein [Gammaproteobacteria bacterium]